MSLNWNRALASSAVYAGVAWAITGGRMGWYSILMNAGVQAGSSVGSDLLHSVLAIQPSGVSDAAATGAIHTAVQWVRGDRAAWMTNLAASAGSQLVGSSVSDMWAVSGGSSPASSSSMSAMEQVATLEAVSA